MIYLSVTEVLPDGKSGQTFWRRVPDKSSRTLISFIRSLVRPNGKVRTDGLVSYEQLCMLFEHSVVIHAREFVARDGTHTNHAENAHKVIKEMLKQLNSQYYGTTEDLDKRVAYCTMVFGIENVLQKQLDRKPKAEEMFAERGRRILVALKNQKEVLADMARAREGPWASGGPKPSLAVVVDGELPPPVLVDDDGATHAERQADPQAPAHPAATAVATAAAQADPADDDLPIFELADPAAAAAAQADPADPAAAAQADSDDGVKGRNR